MLRTEYSRSNNQKIRGKQTLIYFEYYPFSVSRSLIRNQVINYEHINSPKFPYSPIIHTIISPVKLIPLTTLHNFVHCRALCNMTDGVCINTACSAKGPTLSFALSKIKDI